MIAVRHYQDTRPPTLPQYVTTPPGAGKSGGGLIFAQNMLGGNAVRDSQALHHCCFSGRIFPYPAGDQEMRRIAPLQQVHRVQDTALEGRTRLRVCAPMAGACERGDAMCTCWYFSRLSVTKQGTFVN